MIFISVGTQKFQFNRLLKYIDKKIEEGKIQGKVFAQIGNSDYIPKNYEYSKFLTKEEFKSKIDEATIVIAHSGVGTIISALNAEKKVIVVPRLVKYNEHVDNHQLEIAETFSKKNLVLSNGENIEDLLDNINKAKKTEFNKYKSSNEKIQSIIYEFIENNEKSKKIKVLMLGSDYKTVKGGIVSVIRNYVEYDKWNNVILKFIHTHREGNKLFKLIYFLISLIRVDFNLLLHEYDIIHIHVSERGSISRKNIIIKHVKVFSPKSRIVLHHHGAEFDLEYERMDEKNKKMVQQMLKDVDVNIVLSNRLVNSIKDKQPEANIEVLYNAVNTYKKNMYNTNGNILLFLGRLGKRKGTYDFIDVLYQIKDELLKKNIKVYLCGDGEIDEVNNVIEKLELNNVVEHVGWINKEEKSEILRNTLINILPSYNEGLPMTILETMAYGIPNISTNIASIPEVIKDDSLGYLISPGDKKNLRDKIILLTNEKEKRKEQSINSYNYITKNFSLENNIKKLEEIYMNEYESK